MAGIIRSHYTATITSDASGTWDCGAFSSVGEWFQLEWKEGYKYYHQGVATGSGECCNVGGATVQ